MATAQSEARVDAIPARDDRDARATLVVAAWTAVALAVTLIFHRTPLYFVETDLLGEYIPAARNLAHGAIVASNFGFKGPGYPALLALFALPCGGDFYLAARLLSVVAAGLSGWLAYRLVRALSGPRIAWLALAIVLSAPVFLRYAIEAGTDAPALALMLGATVLTLEARSARKAALAGLVAACAVLTRGNAGFLPVAATVVLLVRPHRIRNNVAYSVGFSLPMVAWSAACMTAGVAIQDRNYLNVAYELLGRDLTWGDFESTIGSRFGSLGQVLAFDPLRTTGRIVWNLFAHRIHDLREVVPLWLGLAALAGFLPLARNRAWRWALLHAGLCAITLAAVFYNARFSLYLLPFYAAAAATALALSMDWVTAHRPAFARAAAGAAAVMVVVSGAVALVSLGGSLATAPFEVRRAAAALVRLERAGSAQDAGRGPVMARKPHVAYFAGMTYAPMPAAGSLFELANRARTDGVEWLVYSRVERTTRPEFAVLADSAVKLPGLTPVAFDGAAGHEYAIYRIERAAPDSEAFAQALSAEVELSASRHPRDPDAQVFAALQLVQLGRNEAALRCLDALRAAGHDDARAEQLRTDACLALGRLDSAAVACERALALAPPIASRWARLGEIRARERRFDLASVAYERAVALEPGQGLYLERLGLAYIQVRQYQKAGEAFDRCLALEPRDVAIRRYSMGAWQLAGNIGRMRQRYEEGVRLGLSPTALQGPDPL